MSEKQRDPMSDPVTYTTPAENDTATAPPPSTPQGDGEPAPAAPETGNGSQKGGASQKDGGPAAPSGGKPPARVRMTWSGEHRFDVGRPGGPTVRTDASARTGPSPVDMLVGALASCVSVDVVDILAKRRTPVESLTVDATAERANATPARVVSADLAFTITGAGIERVHVERAIELAVTKYCSVRDSLDPELPVRWTIELNGEKA